MGSVVLILSQIYLYLQLLWILNIYYPNSSWVCLLIAPRTMPKESIKIIYLWTITPSFKTTNPNRFPGRVSCSPWPTLQPRSCPRSREFRNLRAQEHLQWGKYDRSNWSSWVDRDDITDQVRKWVLACLVKLLCVVKRYILNLFHTGLISLGVSRNL